ncbi:MAG: glycerol dehydrogenase [Streptococcaceae bacterium]|jgi:glycerol dehydrogenase|nr:glycerol dehydrogenase [Streptococcaceae bacterium]
MTKIICSPGSFIIGDGEITKLANYSSLKGKKAYILVDPFIAKTYQADILSSFISQNLPQTFNLFGGECSKNEIDRHLAALDGADVIIGIGGGKTLDSAKAVAYYAHVPAVIVPTAASSDAPCSRLSVIYSDGGEFESYLFLTENPAIVIMDSNLIAHAPVRMLVSGIGDALATWYEARACEQSNALTMVGAHSTRAALALAKLCRDILFEDGLKAKIAVKQQVSTKALENIIEANTYLSGIGFESSGLAAAHAVHNGLTALDETHKYLHGEKVAFGLLTQLMLENTDNSELEQVIHFCKSVGLPTCLKDLGIDAVSDERLMNVAVLSCAEGDTMACMPFKVSPEDVFAAIKAADQFSQTIV